MKVILLCGEVSDALSIGKEQLGVKCIDRFFDRLVNGIFVIGDDSGDVLEAGNVIKTLLAELFAVRQQVNTFGVLHQGGGQKSVVFVPGGDSVLRHGGTADKRLIQAERLELCQRHTAVDGMRFRVYGAAEENDVTGEVAAGDLADEDCGDRD